MKNDRTEQDEREKEMIGDNSNSNSHINTGRIQYDGKLHGTRARRENLTDQYTVHTTQQLCVLARLSILSVVDWNQ